MKKWLLLIICVFLITGCKVEYNVTINDDAKVLESVNMTGEDAFFDTYYKTLRINVIKSLLAANGNEDLLKDNHYDYKVVEDKKYPYVLANKEYNDIDSYANSSIFFEQFFDKVEVTKKDNIITFKASEFKPNSPQDLSRFDVGDATINITSKYKVVKNNADSISEKDNIYTWNITNNTEDLEIILAYDIGNKYRYINTDILKLIGYAAIILVASWLFVIFSKKK